MINYTPRPLGRRLRCSYIAGWQSGMFRPADMMEEFAAKAESRDPSFDEIPERPGLL